MDQGIALLPFTGFGCNDPVTGCFGLFRSDPRGNGELIGDIQGIRIGNCYDIIDAVKEKGFARFPKGIEGIRRPVDGTVVFPARTICGCCAGSLIEHPVAHDGGADDKVSGICGIGIVRYLPGIIHTVTVAVTLVRIGIILVLLQVGQTIRIRIKSCIIE